MRSAAICTRIGRLLLLLVVFALAVAFPMAMSHSQPTTVNTWGKLFRSPFPGWWTGAAPTDIITTSDGGYVATVVWNKYEGGNRHSGIIKFDGNGNLVWNRLFGGDGEAQPFRNITLQGVIQNRDGGYTAVGYLSEDTSAGRSLHVLVIRLNADGSVRWQRVYERVRDSVVGDAFSGLDGQRVYERSDGHLIVTGRLEVGQASPCAGHWENGLALHLDPSGQLLNHYLFGGTGLFAGDQRTYYTNGGEYLLITSAWTGTEYTANLQKYSANGELIWSHFYGSKIDTKYAFVAEVSDGYLVVAERSDKRDSVLFKINSSGNVVWQRALSVYGGSSRSIPVFLAVDSDGGALALFSNGFSTLERTLVKTDADGRLRWARNYKSANVTVMRPAPGGGYIAGAAGYETLFARLDEQGMLEHACTALPQEPANITEASLDPLSIREGPQRHACSNTVAGGTWRARDVDVRFDASFQQSGVCAPTNSVYLPFIRR